MYAKSMTRGATLLLVVTSISLGAGTPLWAQPISWNVTWLGEVEADSAIAVAIQGSFAYVAAGESGLRVMDVYDPETPYQAGIYDTDGIAVDVALSSDYAYVADTWNGLRVVNVSNPNLPYEESFYQTDGWAYGVAISRSSHYAYVAQETFGLVMLDISALPPAPPSFVGDCPIPGAAWSVAAPSSDMDEHYAYVASGEIGGLAVVDVLPSSPDFMTVVGFYDTPGYAEEVALSWDDHYAYVADGYAGVEVFDVSTPTPSLMGPPFDTGDWANGVVECRSRELVVYIADQYAGLRVVDFTNPATPVELGFYDTPGYDLFAHGVASFDYNAFVANCSYLSIYDCSAALPVESEKPAEIPASFTLCAPHPNPFNASTVISFELPVANLVQLAVFDINGRAVGAHGCAPWSRSETTLNMYEAGTHQITFDGSGLPSGIYLARLTAGEWSAVQKMVLLK